MEVTNEDSISQQPRTTGGNLIRKQARRLSCRCSISETSESRILLSAESSLPKQGSARSARKHRSFRTGASAEHKVLVLGDGQAARASTKRHRPWLCHQVIETFAGVRRKQPQASQRAATSVLDT